MKKKENGRKLGAKKSLKYASILAAAGLFLFPVAVRKADLKRSSGKPYKDPFDLEQETLSIRSASDGTMLNVRVSGSGDKTVFFVHGWTCNGSIFHHQQRFLMERYRVVTVDLRGHGESDMPASRDYCPDRLAEDLKGVVDHFRPEEFAIAGHSLGGFVAFSFHKSFAKEYEGRLKGMIIIDSTGTDLVDGIIFGNVIKRLYPIPLDGFIETVALSAPVLNPAIKAIKKSSLAYLVVRWAVFGKKPDLRDVEFIADMALSTDVVSIAYAARACLQHHALEYLPRIATPVLLLVGTKDKLTDIKSNETTMALLPDASLVTFEDAGHCAQMEQHEDFNKALGDFLYSVMS